MDFRGARILTGNEEGSFGWITVNYLLETLVKVWAGGEGRGGVPSLLCGGPGWEADTHVVALCRVPVGNSWCRAALLHR